MGIGMAILKAQNLSRSFKRSQKDAGFSGAMKNLFARKFVVKNAVKDISFEIKEGSFTGLVGANGAGKTTLLKMCAGLLHPTSGSLEAMGHKPADRNHDFLKNIGMVMGQKSQLWSDIAPRDSLELFGAIYEIPKPELKRRIDEFTTLFGVTHLLGVQVRRLSLGERMKFELIAALLHQPKLLLLDEPTIGLDLIAKEAVRKFINEELRKRNVTVIFSSHDMEDIQEVCEQMMIIAQGELKYFGGLNDFKKQDEHFKQTVLKLISEPEVKATTAGDLSAK